MTGTGTPTPVDEQPVAEQRAYRLTYMPAFDGLRAIAITLVVLFHYPWVTRAFKAPPFHGGFLGVDVFFVLSGFLITTLLLQERNENGRVRLGAFYVRRARRLLPAFAVLFVIALVMHLSGNAQPNATGLFGMAFYMANWVQIWRPDSIGGVFGHTWSLAIEEQFYLLFPLLLLGLIRLGFRRIGIACALLAGAIGAWAWRIVLWNRQATKSAFVDFYAALTGRALPTTDPLRFRVWNRWYFGTDARADALLIGCAAAAVFVVLSRRQWSKRVVATGATVAVLAFVASGFIVARAKIPSGWIPNWGLLLLEVCVALTVLGVVVAPRAPLAALLSLPPLVWIGRRSYAIYLFHNVLFDVLRRERTHLSSPLQFWMLMIAILVAAEISWRFVESPFMRGRRRFEVAPSTVE